MLAPETSPAKADAMKVVADMLAAPPLEPLPRTAPPAPAKVDYNLHLGFLARTVMHARREREPAAAKSALTAVLAIALAVMPVMISSPAVMSLAYAQPLRAEPISPRWMPMSKGRRRLCTSPAWRWPLSRATR